MWEKKTDIGKGYQNPERKPGEAKFGMKMLNNIYILKLFFLIMVA